EPDVDLRLAGVAPIAHLLDLDAPMLGDVELGDALDFLPPRLLVLGDLPELQGDLGGSVVDVPDAGLEPGRRLVGAGDRGGEPGWPFLESVGEGHACSSSVVAGQRQSPRRCLLMVCEVVGTPRSSRSARAMS